MTAEERGELARIWEAATGARAVVLDDQVDVAAVVRADDDGEVQRAVVRLPRR
jgi:hypothetical protein